MFVARPLALVSVIAALRGVAGVGVSTCRNLRRRFLRRFSKPAVGFLRNAFQPIQWRFNARHPVPASGTGATVAGGFNGRCGRLPCPPREVAPNDPAAAMGSVAVSATGEDSINRCSSSAVPSPRRVKLCRVYRSLALHDVSARGFPKRIQVFRVNVVALRCQLTRHNIRRHLRPFANDANAPRVRRVFAVRPRIASSIPPSSAMRLKSRLAGFGGFCADCSAARRVKSTSCVGSLGTPPSGLTVEESNSPVGATSAAFGVDARSRGSPFVGAFAIRS